MSSRVLIDRVIQVRGFERTGIIKVERRSGTFLKLLSCEKVKAERQACSVDLD